MRARALSKRIGAHTLLRDVDLEASPGKPLALCGPNGAGKSTLLRILAGLDGATSGEVLLDGRPLRRWTARQLARRRALVCQHSPAEVGLSVLDVVALGRLPHGDWRRGPKLARQVLMRLDLWSLANRRMHSLSGGERQRVHLARALCQLEGVSRPVLLLDEPTAALDLRHQHQTMGAVAAWAHARQGTAIVVLHDLNQAARWAHRVALLRRGRLHCAGPPRDVFTTSNLAEVYGVRTHILDHPDHDHPLVVPSTGEPDVGPVHPLP